jgi:dipeptidyl aminopeptidase/acylaminoacyl peptidase
MSRTKPSFILSSLLVLALAHAAPAQEAGQAPDPQPTQPPAAAEAAPAPEAAAGTSSAGAAEPAAGVEQYTIEQFMASTRITDSSFSPDESRILYSSNASGIFNAYAVPVAGGDPQQLTDSTTDSTFAVSYFRNDPRFLFTRDKGGDELDHLYLHAPDGTQRDLTPGEKLKAIFTGWNRDGESFYFMTNERDEKFFDVYKMPVATLERELLYQDDTGYQLGDISNDERWIAFAKSNTTADSDIYLYDRQAKAMKHLTPHEGSVSFNPQTFDPDSKYLYYTTDEGSEFAHVARYELATGKTETVQQADWDVWYTYFSRNGKYRVVGINQDARTKIEVYDTATGKPVELPALPEGDITAVNISPSERLMAFYFNGSRQPNDLYVYDFASRQVRRLTASLNPEIDPADLVDGRVVRFPSFDELAIPSILYQPHQASPEHKVPALVWVHGGPGGQTRIGYSPVIQYLVNHGYAVLGINNRGSTGYGKTFFTADDQKHGREPLWDCVEGKDYLASLDWVDPDRIGILGGSYGGYMVLAALAFKPEAFDVGVDIFGVANWLRTLESIPPWWESFREALYQEMGNPETDRDNLHAISPLFHAEKIKRPLIVLQGANDPRVLKVESDEIVAAIKENGGVAEYVLFDDEGHGFTKRANEIRGYKAILEFLDRYLKGGGAAAPAH